LLSKYFAPTPTFARQLDCLAVDTGRLELFSRHKNQLVAVGIKSQTKFLQASNQGSLTSAYMRRHIKPLSHR